MVLYRLRTFEVEHTVYFPSGYVYSNHTMPIHAKRLCLA